MLVEDWELILVLEEEWDLEQCLHRCTEWLEQLDQVWALVLDLGQQRQEEVLQRDLLVRRQVERSLEVDYVDEPAVGGVAVGVDVEFLENQKMRELTVRAKTTKKRKKKRRMVMKGRVTMTRSPLERTWGAGSRRSCGVWWSRT